MMATRKHATARRTVSPARADRSGPSLKRVPNEVAVRYRTGRERRVLDALSPYGSVDAYPLHRIIVLRRASGVAGAKVQSVLSDLQHAGVVEFVTPVLLDPESQTRQVLTDEIVVRLKPGTSQRALEALKAKHGLEIGKRNKFEPSQYIVRVPKPSGTQTLDVARSLDRSADVEFACPNFLTQIKR
jgi:Fervidolysin N-terminal prodomain